MKRRQESCAASFIGHNTHKPNECIFCTSCRQLGIEPNIDKFVIAAYGVFCVMRHGGMDGLPEFFAENAKIRRVCVMKQTTRINGARKVITTSATGKVTIKPALPFEWELQAAQVRALRAHPAYGRSFLLAGDMNAGKRGPRAQQQAIATGMTPGEPDMRLYFEGGRLVMIENKVGNGRLGPSQKERHADLTRLGFEVHTVAEVTTEAAAARAVAIVDAVLGSRQ